MSIWSVTGTPAPTVGVREESILEMHNIPLMLAVLAGVLALVCGFVLLCFFMKKRKNKKSTLQIAFLTLLLLTSLVACGQKEESYVKTGETEQQEDNSTIPGDGHATEDDLQRPGSTDALPSPAGPTLTPEQGERTYVVALDAGHGGGYPGAQFDGRVEKEENWKLVQKVQSYLAQNYPNVTVVLTREGDEVLSSDLAEDLRLRVEKAKNAGADVLLSFHFNASEDHSRSGSMVCVSKQENVGEASRRLAGFILEQLSALGLKNNGAYERASTDTVDENGVPVDYYAINRHGASMDLVAVIVESCYMDNETDIPFMSTDSALDALAKASAEGIMDYLESLP